jgi:hypothetical protein
MIRRAAPPRPVSFTILMPFSRPHNAGAVKAMFAAATEGLRGGATLVFICHNRAHEKLFDRTVFSELSPGFDSCYWKLNTALSAIAENGEKDYVGFMSDDDTYEPGFFADLELCAGMNMRQGELPGVLLVSAKQWNHNANEVVSELPAQPDRMRIGAVNLTQGFFRADLLAGRRFINDPGADGEMISRLYRERGDDFLFLPELFTNWNKLPA